MKKNIAFVTIALLVSSSLFANPSSTEYFINETYSLNQQQQNSSSIHFINMQAKPDWVLIKTHFLKLKVPYSSQWKIASLKILPINSVTPLSNDKELLYFGRYVSLGTFLVREYSLTIKADKHKDISNSHQRNECFDVFDTKHHLITPPPQKVTIGNIHGMSYLSGGAKGCSTVFDFKIKNTLLSLAKIYPIGSDNLTHTVTPEMRRIIQNIKIQNNT